MAKSVNHKSNLSNVSNYTDKYELLINSLDDLFFRINSDFQIEEANDAFCAFLNKRKEEIMGKKCYELIHNTNAPLPDCPFLQTKNNSSFVSNTIDRKLNGNYFSVKSHAIVDENKSLIGMFALMRNINSLVDEKIEASKAKSSLEKAEQIAAIGHWQFDLSANLVSASKGAKAIYGVESETLSIPEAQRIPIEEYRPMMDKALVDLIKEGKTYDLEFKIQRQRDGEIRDIHSVAEYIPEKNIVFGVIQDISDSKRKEFVLKERLEEYLTLNEEYTAQNEQLFKAKKLAEEQEDKYRNLFNNRTDIVIVYELSEDFEVKGIVELNDTALEELGYSYEDLKTMNPFNLLIEDDKPKILSCIDELVKNDKASFELTAICKDGKRIELDVNSNLLRINGKILAINVARNITQRKLLVGKITESEKRYKSLFYDNKSIMLLIDPDSLCIIDANQSALDYYGYKREELASKKISDINVLPENEVLQEMSAALAEKRNYFQFKHRLASNEIRDVQVYSGKIVLNDKELLYSIVHDNTDEVLLKQKLKEQNEEYLALNEELEENIERLQELSAEFEESNKKLEESDERYQSFIRHSSEGIYRIELTEPIDITLPVQKQIDLIYERSYLAEYNLVFARMYDVNDNESMIGKTLPELYGEQENQGNQESYEHFIANGYKVEALETWERKSDGTPVYFLNNVIGVVKDGKLLRTWGTQTDITALKKLEKDLLEAKEKAEESDRLKSAFLANVSHEIRTPMNGIVGFAEMLLNSDLKKEKQEFYSKIIVENSKQLLTIVNDILDLSKIESNDLPINRKTVGLNQLMDELYAFYKPQMLNKPVSLHAEKGLADGQDCVLSDANRLKQILSNLVGNAIKFTQEGYVKFGYYLKNNNIVFYVEDTGIGIKESDHVKVFDRFWQAEMELTNHSGGTGLGLSICKKLVELLGGNIWVESVQKEGTTFFFSHPYVSMGKDASEEKPVIEADSQLYTILIAEDEDVNYLYLKEILKADKRRILRTKNGQETIDLCKSDSSIALVLMDIKMPVLDGITATKRIKEFRPDLTILAQSAYALNEYKLNAFDAGCSEYFVKPIDSDLLIKRIHVYEERHFKRNK